MTKLISHWDLKSNYPIATLVDLNHQVFIKTVDEGDSIPVEIIETTNGVKSRSNKKYLEQLESMYPGRSYSNKDWKKL